MNALFFESSWLCGKFINMSSHERLFNWIFWLQWVLASTLGWLLGNAFIPEISIGATLGIAQWLILRPWVSNAGWWVVASTAGWLIGGTSLLIISPPQNETITGAIFGLWIGLAQWIVLRKWVPLSGWWLVISALGWAIGFSSLVSSPFVGAIIGAITGIGLELLLRYSKRNF